MPSKVTTPIIIRLENDIIARLDALATQQSSSRSAAARAALAAGLETLQGPPQQKPGATRKTGRRAESKPEDVPPAEPSPAKGTGRGKKAARAKAAAAEGKPAEGFDLVGFAVQVLESARGTRTGRFGDDRVLINHVWRQFERDYKPDGMDLEAFKRHLGEANQARLLSLMRANRAPGLDQKDVKESETRHLSGKFHFLSV